MLELRTSLCAVAAAVASVFLIGRAACAAAVKSDLYKYDVVSAYVAESVKGELDTHAALAGLLHRTSLEVAGTPESSPVSQETTAPLSEADRRRVDHAIPNFIESHAAPARTGQYARWYTAICPRIAGGLPADFAQFLRGRIADVAESVGARANRDPHCDPNVQVFFAAEPQKQLDELVRSEPVLLGYDFQSQSKGAATFGGLIRPWYLTATRGRYDDVVRDTPDSPFTASMNQSSVSDKRSSLIWEVVVIADARKMAGYPVGPVADYIAMLILTKTRSLDGCGELPSILDLLASNCRPGNQPAALTEADTAFLKALYSIDMNLAASMQRSRIRKQMLRELGGS
jgi:hypothetical protein